MANRFGEILRPGHRRDSDIDALPAPATLLLLGSGVAGVIAWRRKIV